jgi:hypothetical protein
MSPLHNATIVSVLCDLAGLLFHKFGFFMDWLRTLHGKYTYLVLLALLPNKKETAYHYLKLC